MIVFLGVVYLMVFATPAVPPARPVTTALILWDEVEATFFGADKGLYAACSIARLLLLSCRMALPVSPSLGL